MNMLVLYVIAFLLLLGCESTRDVDVDRCYLRPSDQFLSFPVPDDTALPYDRVKVFTVNNTDYLAFVGSDNLSLYIYELGSGHLVKNICYEAEGNDGVIGISEFLIEDFDHIYLSAYVPVIFRTDTSGRILQRINYSQTTEEFPVPLRSMSRIMGPIAILNHSIYIPSNINPHYGNDLIEKSRVGIVVDTVNRSVSQLPLGFPSLITYRDLGTGTGSGYGCYYSRCFDGESFVYGFLYNDLMYKASIDHHDVLKKEIKSQYAPNIEVFHIKGTSGFNEHLKIEAESSVYGDCMYDPYREVYYRFAYPSSELEADDSYVEILRNGRKKLSIMILDKNLNLLGETLFPDFAYSSRAHFVGRNGLYLSVSHFKRDDYSEDTLRFQRLELVYK
ncbi:DUF4221 family protein [Parabacteroides sp.]